MEQARTDYKRELRARMRAARQSLPLGERLEASRLIEEHVIDLPEYAEAFVVLLYASTDEEVNTEGLIDRGVLEGKNVVLPRMEDGGLALHQVSGREDLSPGPYGIFEPRLTLPIVPPEQVDLAVVPGLAFDEGGHRLGMGKGYYDRLLPRLAKALKVGVAFELQIVDEVPRDENDVPVDVVVTERRVIRATR